MIPNDPNWLQLIPRESFPPAILDPVLGKPLSLPVKHGVFIHHTVTPYSGNWHNDLNQVIDTGLKRFGHLSYKYLYHKEHRILIQGQGPRRSADTAGYNSTSISIAVIGNTHPAHKPVAPIFLDEEDARRIARSINWFRAIGLVHANCPIRPHQAVKATACPGSGVMELFPLILETAADSEGLGAWKRPEAPSPPPPPPPPPPGEVDVPDDVVAALRDDIVQVAQDVDRLRGKINANTDNVLEVKVKLVALGQLVERMGSPPSLTELIDEISRRLSGE